MAKSKTVVATASGRLAGKIAIVTGAAGNLGGEIVRHYLAEGATVVMTGRTAARTDAAAKAIIAETGSDPERLMTVELDGADPQSVRDGIAKVIARFGRIDILVNNAGSAGPKQTLGSLPLDAKETAAIEAMIGRFAAAPSPMSALLLEHFHGAATRVSPSAAAFPPIWCARKSCNRGGSAIRSSRQRGSTCATCPSWCQRTV